MTAKGRDGIWVPISHLPAVPSVPGGSGCCNPGICWVMLLCSLSQPGWQGSESLAASLGFGTHREGGRFWGLGLTAKDVFGVKE